MRKRIELEEQDIEAARASTTSMAETAKLLGVSFATLKRRSMELGVYKPNQGKSGMARPKAEGVGGKLCLEDILAGKHPQYGTGKLKHRLIEAGLKKEECEDCGITDWRGKKLVLQLDHRDGNSFNHELTNLRLLCPNCHSQTATYCRGHARVAK